MTSRGADSGGDFNPAVVSLITTDGTHNQVLSNVLVAGELELTTRKNARKLLEARLSLFKRG